MIDGFASEDDICFEIVPPIYRNNYIYMGIKSAVLVLEPEFICEEVRQHVNNKVKKSCEE